MALLFILYFWNDGMLAWKGVRSQNSESRRQRKVQIQVSDF